MMEVALDRRFVGVEAGLEDLVGLELGLGRLHVGLLAAVGHRIAHDMRDALLGRAGPRPRAPRRSARAGRGRPVCGWHD